MNNVQPSSTIETPTEAYTSLKVRVPQLSLPQVMPALVIAKRQHSYASVVHLKPISQTLPFPQTPVTPPLSQMMDGQAPVLQMKKDASSLSLLSGPQLPFPTPRQDFSRSLRARVIYIPRSMSRHKEPNGIDALIACSTLVLIGLFILMLLYYFSM